MAEKIVLCDGCYEEFPDDEIGKDGLCLDCAQIEQEENGYGYDYDEEYHLIDGVGFADPGGRSSLRAATRDNPRDRACPTCGAQNVLTRIDVERGYQCNSCADNAERF